MATGTTRKICCFCGESCAEDPRGRDSKGRYYHVACLEARRAAKAFKRNPAPAPPRTDPSLIEPAPARTEHCPECGKTLAFDDLVCTGCGFDRATGQVLTSTVATAPVARGPDTSPGQMAIGIVSTALGAGLVLASAWRLIADALGAAGVAGTLIGRLALAAVTLVLSLMLFIGGIGVIQRRREGVAMLRRWSFVQGALALAGAAPALIYALHAPSDPAMTAAEAQRLLAVVITLLAIFILWPITLLVWRKRMLEEIVTWD